MNTTTQHVETKWVSGKMTITVDPVGKAVAEAEHDGATAGRLVLSTSLTSALGPSLRRAKELVAKDRYQALSQFAEELTEKLGAEARATSRQAELKKFQANCRFLAQLAREAGKTDQP